MKKYHHMFEASNCNAEALLESARISACIRRIAESTNSFVLNEPIIVSRKIGVIGITGALVTQSSHIIIHTFLESKEASLDVYSYHPLNPIPLKELFAQHFGTSTNFVASFERYDTQKLQQNNPHVLQHPNQHGFQQQHQRDNEEIECKEPGCSKKATKVWGGRAVCDDHYDYYRDKEDQIKHLYPFE